MGQRGFAPILLGCVLGSTPAWAVPTLSIDLDVGLPGVQSTRTILVGDSVDVAVVLTGDGLTLFDTTIFDLTFNSGPPVLDLAPGGEPTAGALAGTAPVLALDVFGASPVLSGGPLTPKDPVVVNRLGGIGMSSLVMPFPVVGNGVDSLVAQMTFDSFGVGQTTLELATVTQPDFILALNNRGLEVSLQSASLTVRPETAAPEPGTILLLLTGLLACARRGRLIR